MSLPAAIARRPYAFPIGSHRAPPEDMPREPGNASADRQESIGSTHFPRTMDVVQ